MTQPEASSQSKAPIQKSDDEWRTQLTPAQFRVMRQHGTEAAFTGQYDDFYKNGVYTCAGCGYPLFTSEAKFHSGSGWPSFYEPLSDVAVEENKDTSWGMVRTEVHCKACHSHLGHVFEDGPKPTGLRYCMNSVCLDFIPSQGQ
jgi:peptide-methionine (R)-S-oxide reductase